MDFSGMGGGMGDGGGGDAAPQKPDINAIISQLQDVLSQLQDYAQACGEGSDMGDHDDQGQDKAMSPLGGLAMPAHKKGPLYGS